MNEDKSSKHGKVIKIGGLTLERLEKLRHKGQTYDGVVAELLDYHDSRERGKSSMTGANRRAT